MDVSQKESQHYRQMERAGEHPNRKYTLRHLLLSLLMQISLWTYAENKKPAADVTVVSFEELQPLLQQKNDTVYVVNFWATWCAPCIKEIPSFEQLGEKYRDKRVKVLMVSLDIPKDLHSRLIPFVEKANMHNKVLLLNDPNSNHWIPLVDENWTGVIPATLIYGNGFRHFYQQEFTFEELDALIYPLL
jgi:thiol-disulfide isomerase/thioredoxin